MNQYEKAIIVAFLASYLPAFGLYHFMLIRVNSLLPPDRRLPHSLSWGEWNRLKREYKSFYPRSILYELTVSSAAVILVLALALFALRFWEYFNGK